MADVEQRGDSYRIKVSCGYDLNGKQITKKKTWKPDSTMTQKQIEKELNKQKVLFEEKCKSGQFLDGSINFAEFAERWFLDHAEKQLKRKTIARYREMMNRINQAIGHIKLEKLQPHHLIGFYSNLEEAGIRADTKYKPHDGFNELLKSKGLTKLKLSKLAHVSVGTINACGNGSNVNHKSAEAVCKALECAVNKLFSKSEAKPLSSKTIRHHHRLISSILNTAVQWQVMPSNPCDRVKPPKVDIKESRYLDDKETARLLELLEEAPIMYKAITHLFLYTGFRRGELCGLEWKDLDFVNSTISVRRSSLYLPSIGVFEDTTKNHSSDRIIKVSTSAMELMKDYKKTQNIERLKLGELWEDNDKLFTQWNGKPIHPDSVSNWFSGFIKKSDLPNVSIHSLRHTNATLLIASGTPLKTVSKRLGHAQLSTTSNIYAHAIQTTDEAAAETLQDILKPNQKAI